MSVSSHEVILGSISGTRQNVTYIFTADNGDVISLQKLLPIGTDFEADALSLYSYVESLLAKGEIGQAFNDVDNQINPDKIAEHNTQPDFDRRVLGYIMTMDNPHTVNACLPFWSAMQIRNGANAAQRAASLGVPEVEYDEVETRFNNVIGVSSFLTNDMASAWDEIKGDWE